MKLLLATSLCLATGLGVLAWRSPATLLNWTVPRHHLTVVRDVVFDTAHGLTLDIYRPTTSTGPLPVIVFFYGGGWKDGSKDLYPFVGEALASRGFLVAIPDYRVYPAVRFPTFLDDCAAAVAWVHRHIAVYGGAADRLFLTGHSAGAYNAAMLLLDGRSLQAESLGPEAISGFVGLAGPYDFVPEDGPTLPFIFEPANAWSETQPIRFAANGAPPTLLMVGSTDTTVLPRNSHRLARALAAAGTEVAVETYPQLGHIGLITALAGVFRWRAPVLDDMVAFLRRSETPNLPLHPSSR